MTGRSPGSQMARQYLGSGLKRLREKADIRLDTAARELECSIAKISRLENGLGPAKLWDVRILLDLYGVEDREDRDRFEQWARNSKAVGWWEPDADLATDDLSRYLSAETEAARVRIFCAPNLPGQLQTADYARAHIAALHPDWTAEDVERFVALRLARQEALLREDDPLEVDVVLDEAAVRRRVGTPAVHAAALAWLLDVLDRRAGGALTLRIVPFSAGPSRAVSTFTIFDPRHPDLSPSAAHSEDAFGERWMEVDELNSLNEIFSEVTRLALDPAASRQLMEEISRGGRPTAA